MWCVNKLSEVVSSKQNGRESNPFVTFTYIGRFLAFCEPTKRVKATWRTMQKG